jgi:hypothetical protein
MEEHGPFWSHFFGRHQVSPRVKYVQWFECTENSVDGMEVLP